MVIKREKGKKKVIKPNFKPLIIIPPTSGLINLAKELRLDIGVRRKNGGPTLAELGGKHITSRRMVVSMENTGIFYLNLAAELYGGEIMKKKEAPLFNNSFKPPSLNPDFRPDIIVRGDLGNVYIEAKSVSVNGSKPQFSHRQFLHYSLALLEDNGSEMYSVIFRYGTNKAQKLYRHNCGGLVKELSESTRDVLLIPHNLLAFIFTLSCSDKRDQLSFKSRYENIRRFYGKWLSFLHKYWEKPYEAINKIVEHAKRIPPTDDEIRTGNIREWDEIEKRLDKNKFYLWDIQTKQYLSPPIYCRNRRIGNSTFDRRAKAYRDWKKSDKMKKLEFKSAKKPFIVTEYRMPDMGPWVDYFRDNFEEFLVGMGMKGDYDEILSWAEMNEEREAIKKESKAEVVIETPDDGVPI